MVLEKDNAIKAWRDLAGPTNTEKARELAPNRYRNHRVKGNRDEFLNQAV